MHRLATIGYEGASVADFLDALRGANSDLLVDVRAVAMSRRPGFAKTALAANLRDAGIDYLHLRQLGTPADGRAAARGGDHVSLLQELDVAVGPSAFHVCKAKNTSRLQPAFGANSIVAGGL